MDRIAMNIRQYSLNLRYDEVRFVSNVMTTHGSSESLCSADVYHILICSSSSIPLAIGPGRPMDNVQASLNSPAEPLSAVHRLFFPLGILSETLDSICQSRKTNGVK